MENLNAVIGQDPRPASPYTRHACVVDEKKNKKKQKRKRKPGKKKKENGLDRKGRESDPRRPIPGPSITFSSMTTKYELPTAHALLLLPFTSGRDLSVRNETHLQNKVHNYQVYI